MVLPVALSSQKIPSVTKDGVTAVVIAGEALGVKSPVYTRTPTHYLHFFMEKNSVLHQPVPAGWNCFAYVCGPDVHGLSDVGFSPHLVCCRA